MTLLPTQHRLIKASLTLALALSCSLCCNLAATAAAAPEVLPDCPLNQARWLGSHNSFKPVLPPAYYQRVANRLAALIPAEQQAAARQKLHSLEYGHASLMTQLNSGLRLLELDFLKDERGGRYARPLFADDLQQALAEAAASAATNANAAAKESGVTETSAKESAVTATSANKNAVSGQLAAQYLPLSLATPGFKVLHLPDIDFASHCALARDCLTELRQWSEANPGHWPVLIVINVREQGAGAYLPAPMMAKAASKTAAKASQAKPIQVEPIQVEPSQAEPWQATDYAALEQLWLDSLGRDRLLTPDDIRRPGFTLSDSIRQHGWPTLSQAAGRFLLLFDGSAAQLALYRAGHPSLRGRLMFGNYPVDSPEAALLVFNQPATQQAEIASALAQGLLVRTRSDDGNVLQPARFQAALQSRAQFISSDFYQGAPQGEPGVQFRLPAGPFTEALCRPAAQQRPAVQVEAAMAAATAATNVATKASTTAVTKAATNASIKAAIKPGGTP